MAYKDPNDLSGRPLYAFQKKAANASTLSFAGSAIMGIGAWAAKSQADMAARSYSLYPNTTDVSVDNITEAQSLANVCLAIALVLGVVFIIAVIAMVAANLLIAYREEQILNSPKPAKPLNDPSNRQMKPKSPLPETEQK